MDNLWHDLRFTFRSLTGQPGFTAVAVVTLALGIGASTAIFSMIDAVLLDPLPYEDPDRLMALHGPAMVMSPDEFKHLRGASRSVDGWAALDMMDFNLVDDEGTLRTTGAMVTTNYFELFGVRPALGRTFAAEEGEPGKNNVALITHDLWQSRFAGQDDVVGRELEVYWTAVGGPDRRIGPSVTVIGVLPPDFIAPRGPREIWVPLTFGTGDARHYLFSFVRLPADVDPQSAQAELAEIYRAIPRPASWEPDPEEPIHVVSLNELAVRNVRPALLAVSGAVAFVLLIACVNVAHLLLARGSVRQREIAVRLSLGASRGRLVRQLLVESLILALLGGVLGLAVAHGGVLVLQIGYANSVPRLPAISIDGDVLAFAGLLTLLTAVLFGLFPAFRSSDLNLSTALRNGGGGSGSRSRLRHTLVVAEVTLAVVLLVGSGLLVRSFQRLLDVDLGFQAEGVLSFGVALPEQKYSELEQRQAFFRQAVESLEVLPEVESVAAVNVLPFSFINTVRGFTVEGLPKAEGEHWVNYRMASVDYFQTLGIALLSGQTFSPQDLRADPSVVVVNRAMARRYWGEESPIGSSLTITNLPKPMRVIGVVGDVRDFATGNQNPTLYVPSLGARVMGFVVKSRGGKPDALVEKAREVIQSIDPTQPIYEAQALNLRGLSRLSRQRFNALLVTLLAGLALVLSAVGVYGVLSFSVSRRTREMGVRMAIGAQRSDVLRLLITQGLRLVAFGLALGLAASFGLTRFLESLLFGVTATDPVTFMAISAVLFTVSLVAVYLPARRATRVEPVAALRHE